MYYLQSRYYDPNTCRFINADSQLNNSVGILGANLFAYCINDPVNMVDYLGDKPGDLFGSADEDAIDFAEYINENSIKCNSEYAAYIYKVYVCNKTYKTIIFTLLGKEIELTILVDVDILTYYTYSQVIKGGKDNVIICLCSK